jgi:MYXO-CTERM domain-containing protein
MAAAAANGGAGGGGAGGHITLRMADKVNCSGLEARGGNGGANTDSVLHGPGGGGGGGVVLLQGASLTCTATVLPGVAGQAAAAAGGGTHGATPTTDAQPDSQGGVTPIPEAFSPPAVQWVLPADGENTGTRPQLEATTQAGARVSLFLDGAPLGTLEVPEGGRFTFQPTTDLALGPHEVTAYAERLGVRGATAPRTFTVGTLDSLTPLALDVGCGCGATPPAGSALFVLAVLLLGRPRRARPTR